LLDENHNKLYGKVTGNVSKTFTNFRHKKTASVLKIGFTKTHCAFLYFALVVLNKKCAVRNGRDKGMYKNFKCIKKSNGFVIAIMVISTIMLAACGGRNNDYQPAEELPIQTNFAMDATPTPSPATVQIQEEEYEPEEPEEVVIFYTLLSAEDFSDGIAWVEVTPNVDDAHETPISWAAINTEGEILFFVDSRPRNPFVNGLSSLPDGTVIDRTGNVVANNDDPRFDRISRVAGGYIWVQRQIETIDRSETYYGLLNNAGEWVQELSTDWRLRPSARPTLPGSNIFGNLMVVSRHEISGRTIINGEVLVLNIYTMEEVFRADHVTPARMEVGNDSLLLVLTCLNRNSRNDLSLGTHIISSDGTSHRVNFDWGVFITEILDSRGTWGNQRDAALIGFINNLTFSGNNFDLVTGNHFLSVYDIHDNKFRDIPLLQSTSADIRRIDIPVFDGDYAFLSLLNEGGVRFVTIIDREGNPQFEPFRADVSASPGAIDRTRLSEGRAWIRGDDNTFISINTQGEHMITIQANSVRDFQEGFAIIRAEGRPHFIDMDGNKLAIQHRK